MNPSRTRRAPDARGGRRLRDGGYAAVLTALVLVPLLGFAGFAVDVGAWYSRASSIQRAADAAALAGVVWQPYFATAEAAARAEASRNGFTHGVDGVTVTVIDNGDNEIAVEITDTDADLYFASLFIDNVSIGRRAVAEYIEPVPLGSPKNFFGTGTLVTADPENFTAAINGSCTPREQGDHRSTHFMNNWTTAGGSGNMLCPTAAGGPGPDVGATAGNTLYNVNPYYTGQYSYRYAIDVPEGLASAVDVYLRDPNFNRAGPLDTGAATAVVTTEFLLRGPDGTPLDDEDNVAYTGCASGRGTGDGHHAYASGVSTGTTSLFAADGSTWDLFCRIPAGATGRYFLEVGTPAFEAFSIASNQYGVLARATAGPLTCDTRVSPTSCPGVSAQDWMSIFAAGPGATSSFFLAEIDDVHEGKRMLVTLFDPGEGSNLLRILNPDGNPVDFDWETLDGVYSGSGNQLDVSGTCGASCPAGNASTSQFSDRFVVASIPLPADFSSAYTTTDRWWRVQYVAGAAPTDRTSWSVSIVGDPVRLLE